MAGTITKGTLIAVKTLMNKLKGLEQLREPEVVVIGFSPLSGGHVSNMSETDGRALVKHLKGLDPDEQKARPMRRKLCAMAYEYNGLGDRATEGQKKEAVKRLEVWASKYGHVKKRSLNSYSYDELRLLVTQFAKAKSDYLKVV